MYMRIQFTHVIIPLPFTIHKQLTAASPFALFTSLLLGFSISLLAASYCPSCTKEGRLALREHMELMSWILFILWPLSLNTQAPHNPKGPSQQGLLFVVCELWCPIYAHIISYHLTMFCCIYVLYCDARTYVCVLVVGSMCLSCMHTSWHICI